MPPKNLKIKTTYKIIKESTSEAFEKALDEVTAEGAQLIDFKYYFQVDADESYGTIKKYDVYVALVAWIGMN